MRNAYPSEHPSPSCIRLCMCYCKPPNVFPGNRTYRNACDTNFSCGYFSRMMFGRAWLIYEQMRQLCFSEKNTVSAIDGSARLITLKFQCDVGKLSPSVTDQHSLVFIHYTACMSFFFFRLSEFFYPLLGRARFRGRC